MFRKAFTKGDTEIANRPQCINVFKIKLIADKYFNTKFVYLDIYIFNVLGDHYFFFLPYHLAFGISVSQSGTEPGPWQLKHPVLTTGKPGNLFTLYLIISFH